MTDTPPDPLAALLHREMNFRIGIPDLHPDRRAVDEPTCQLLAAHLTAKGVTLRPSGDEALRAAAQSLVDALPYEPGSLLGGKIALVVAALAAPVSPSPEGLDVERLADEIERLPLFVPDLGPNQAHAAESMRIRAAAVVRAALRTPEETPHA